MRTSIIFKDDRLQLHISLTLTHSSLRLRTHDRSFSFLKIPTSPFYVA